jgi:uncharacterized protein
MRAHSIGSPHLDGLAGRAITAPQPLRLTAACGYFVFNIFQPHAAPSAQAVPRLFNPPEEARVAPLRTICGLRRFPRRPAAMTALDRTLCRTWDPEKAAANRVKHGLSFETAVLVLRASKPHPHSDDDRCHPIGLVASVLLLVVHTWPEVTEGGESVGRIISARRATAHERRAYEEGNF